jgi:GAF domain-containing protein
MALYAQNNYTLFQLYAHRERIMTLYAQHNYTHFQLYAHRGRIMALYAQHNYTHFQLYAHRDQSAESVDRLFETHEPVVTRTISASLNHRRPQGHHILQALNKHQLPLWLEV